MTTEASLIKFRKDNPELYEKYILAALNSSQKLWTIISPILCVNQAKHFNINEFDSTIHYGLFLALKLWYDKLSETNQTFSPINDRGLLTSLIILSQATNPVLDSSQVEEYAAYWNSNIKCIDPGDAVATVEPTWQGWLTEKRALKAVQDICRTDGEAAEKAITNFIEQKQVVDSAAVEQSFDTILSALESPAAEPVERFPLSPRTWGVLNEALGGGFGRKEHTLIIAPSGGGKTVIACQIAADMAYNGKNVLYVSTEESLLRVLPRFVSMMSYLERDNKIKYSTIKYKPNFKDYMSKANYETAMKICKKLDSHMLYSDWTGTSRVGNTTRRRNIEEIDLEVERAISKFSERGETLDMVILDWLGATLRAGVTDSGMLRVIYSNAATRMKDIAIRYNIATVSLAQASPDSVKKEQIDNTCVAECHSLHNEAHAAIGISHLATARPEEGQVNEAFREQQCFHVFKSRGGAAKTFWMRENFDYQRFDRIV